MSMLRRLRESRFSVPFHSPAAVWSSLQPALDEELARVLALGSESATEEYLEDFASGYARRAGLPEPVGTPSGTAALSFALLALGLEPGDEVIVPAFTFAGTALAVLSAGAVPVFADVGPDGHLDPAQAERRCGPRTRAVMTVHLYGSMSDPAPLTDLCRKRGLFLIEDACQAHAVKWKGRAAGSFGDAAAFSFNYTKLLCGPGNGGLLCAASRETTRRARLLRDPQSLDALVLRGGRTPGYLDPLQAAAVRAGERALKATLAHRAELAAAYREAGVRLAGDEPGRPHTWYRAVLRAPDREALRLALKRRGVEARAAHEECLPRLAPFAGRPGADGAFPNAEAWAREALMLPMGPHLTADGARRAGEAVFGHLGAAQRL